MDLTQLITAIGFPAGVAAYALYNSYKREDFIQKSLSKAVEDNTKAINELKLLIAEIIGKEKRGHEDDI